MQAIELLKEETVTIANMDMGLANQEPFMIRVNLGLMADMIVEADRELKNQVGQLAYGITALRTMIKSEPIRYRMNIDGEEILTEGVALTVTNCGSIGIGNYSFLPDIRINDGYLDVLLLEQANLGSVLRLAGTTFLQTESQVLKHWKGKEIKIFLEQSQKIILDDFEKQVQLLHIKVLPQVLKVVIPHKSKP
jgi:diacylglycerol kinase family enzyme